LFRDAGGPSGQRGSGCGFSVDRVAFPLVSAQGSVRAIDLDDRDVLGVQVAGEACAVGAGALDADECHGAVSVQPVQ